MINPLFYFLIGLLFFFSSCHGGRHDRRRGGQEFYSCPSAKLSEDQEAQIKELRQNSRSSSRDMSQEERQALKAELQTSIFNEVNLTEEQKTALSECFNRKRNRR